MISLETVRQRAQNDAKTYGYHLHPDPAFLRDLIEGLKRNEERYGYPACPCRLASGKLETDRDIICPCDYRDLDVEEFGCCYCALFVRQDVFEGKTKIVPVPERRPIDRQIGIHENASKAPKITAKDIKKASESQRRLWYCMQCGYMCYRDDPPYICPICKAKRELFSEMSIGTYVKG